MCHRKDEFNQCIENNATIRSAVITTEEIFEIINVFRNYQSPDIPNLKDLLNE